MSQGDYCLRLWRQARGASKGFLGKGETALKHNLWRLAVGPHTTTGCGLDRLAPPRFHWGFRRIKGKAGIQERRGKIPFFQAPFFSTFTLTGRSVILTNRHIWKTARRRSPQEAIQFPSWCEKDRCHLMDHLQLLALNQRLGATRHIIESHNSFLAQNI